MPREILSEDQIHPAIRQKIADNHHDIVAEVQAEIGEHALVVVGMKQNPFPKKARKALNARGTAFRYLEYGSYFSTWRRRTALKMWTGWSTFPMVFVNGVLIGGFEELANLIADGELDRRLATAAAGGATTPSTPATATTAS